MCTPLAKLLEARFPETYKLRRATETQAHEERQAAGAPRTLGEAADKLPLFVLEELLPLQRMRLNVFEPRYRALTRHALAGGRRFGMVGFEGRHGHRRVGVEVRIEECVPLIDGRFHVQVVGTRSFRITDVQQQPEGYLLASVAWLNLDSGGPSEETSVLVAEIISSLENWKALVQSERPDLLATILRDLGPMPAPNRPGSFALWAAALLNPLPPLSVAPEIRVDVLAAESAHEALCIVKAAIENSVQYLHVQSKSPVRRFMFFVLSQPTMAAMQFCCRRRIR